VELGTLGRGSTPASAAAATRVTVKKTRKRKASQKAPCSDTHTSRPERFLWLRRHGWRLALLWTLVLSAYSNSFKADLLYDNDLAILRDVRVHSATSQNVHRILTEGYWRNQTMTGLYRPVTTLSYLFNYAVLGNGPEPAGYHWINLTLHAVNVSLVYTLGVLLFGAPTLGLLFAAMWGLHPLLTDAVTNIVGRADLLAAGSVLAGLLWHVKSVSARGAPKIGWLALLAISQTVGLFSKENAVVLPALMLLYDFTWVERGAWRRRAWSYAALALPFAVFFAARSQLTDHLEVPFLVNPAVSAGFWAARLTAVKVIGKYLWLFVWPARLSPDYSYNAVPVFAWGRLGAEDAAAVIALLVCLAVVWLLVRWYRAWKPGFFLLALFFIALSPMSNLVILIGSNMAERFMYLPAVGLAGCAVALIDALARRWGRSAPRAGMAGTAAIAVLCIAFGARTYARNFDWYDAQSLWTSAVSAVPESALVHLNLGNTLAAMPGRLPDAIAEYQTALRIHPEYAEAHSNLGYAVARVSGRPQDAIDYYRAALRIDPTNVYAHSNLGATLSQMPGHAEEAAAELRAALRIEPDYAEAHSNLGDALAQLPGRLDEAVSEYQEALRINPDLAGAHFNLANAYARMTGRLQEAVAHYEAALRGLPDEPAIHNNFGSTLARMPGRMSDAILQWQTALRLNPNLAQTHYNLAVALAGMPGRREEAIGEIEAGLRILPNAQMSQMLEQMRAQR